MQILKISIFTIYFFSFNDIAFAYLDPGSGSYLFQILIAGLIGLIFTLKLYWKKIITGIKLWLAKRFLF